MHEYALVESLLGRVAAEARARHAIAVHRLKVRVGELSGVDPQLLQTAYDTVRNGTICAGADLEVEHEPASWSCSSCATGLGIGAPLQCPQCGEPAQLSAGADIMLTRIELEVP